MLTKTFSVFAAFCLLSPLCAAADWAALISPRGQIFPALILATANLPERRASASVIGDSNGLIGARMVASRDQQRVVLHIDMPGWLRDSRIEAVLPQRGQRYQIYPTLAWDFDKLRSSRHGAPETLRFSLAVDDQPAEVKQVRVRIRSVNDAPYFIASKKSPTDLSWMFAAYVDEDHPRVTRIINEALATGIVKRFDGYQRKDPQAVLKQVYAIWFVLQKHGIHYSSITRTGNALTEVYAQHVRFLDESWMNNQANCVDGSVLLASVLRKLDLNPALVLMPGHMLLAFELAPGGDRVYLETTRLDNAQANADGALDDAESFQSFATAIARGFAAYQRGQGNFGDLRQPEYQIIDIATARNRGVMPINGR
ncbi:MAG: hypothetical protein COS34_06515 [Lysobacterales bacterium CG02_land_8_20_14_3_00_62_12]|nr:MAG: hypothetical protein COS34_06515 [Xanthomonadales bacterium CG02_land_8_20_14_3_00_62_12]